VRQRKQWGEEGGSMMEDWRKGLEKDIQERERERERRGVERNQYGGEGWGRNEKRRRT